MVPHGAVNGTLFGGLFFNFFVFENGLFMHSKVEAKSI